ncbi:aromatic acid exporter family protein [soil metagenome]
MAWSDRLARWVARQTARQVALWRRNGRAEVAWALRLTTAAVASYVVAVAMFSGTKPLLAPLTALLVVQLTPISLLASGVDRVLSVVAGVSLAVGFTVVFPLTWWSLGLLIAVSLLVGLAIRLGPNLVEVPISAMLVVGVGTLGVESAGWQRLSETLVGAAVGVLSNLLFPPKVTTDEAGEDIAALADELARLLQRAADELSGRELSGDEVSAYATTWLDDSRLLTYDIPRIGSALLRAEQSRRLNLRALGTPDVGPGLRQGLEALEHSSVTVRSMFRSIKDAVDDPGWPGGEVAAASAVVIAEFLRDLAGGIGSFGELVRAEAQPHDLDRTPQVTRVREGREGLREARARINDLLLTDSGPVLTELHFALITTVKRLLRELDLDERIRRQLRSRPAASPLASRARRSRRKPDKG